MSYVYMETWLWTKTWLMMGLYDPKGRAPNE